MTLLRHSDSERPRRARSGCLWVILVFQGFLIFALLLAVMALGVSDLLGKRPAQDDEWGVDEFPPMSEVWSQGDGEAKVVAIPLMGMITFAEEGGFLPAPPGSSLTALQSIRRATNDDDVRALILDIDSGGGGITASDILFDALMEFKASRDDRIVVAVFGDVAASGAYYVSLAADHIIAHPTTLTGSIGVLVQTLNMKELGAKIGVKDVTIKSGANKDLLNPLGELTEGQRLMLQDIVDALHGRFVSLVSTQRGLTEDEVRALADGSVMTADRAQDLGLIDGIGYWADAIDKTAELLGEESVRVYRYEQEFSLSAFLRSMQTWRPSALFERATETRLLYRWTL
jgi:protease-4